MKVWKFFREWIYQSAIGLDNFANAFLFFGSADESISGRCFRLNHIKAYRYAEIFVNCLFWPFQGWEHCKYAYFKDALGRQLPKEFYKKAIEMGLEINPEKLGADAEIPKK